MCNEGLIVMSKLKGHAPIGRGPIDSGINLSVSARLALMLKNRMAQRPDG